MRNWVWVSFSLLLAAPLAADVTYNRDVATIIQHKCAICHHPGDVAPFALESYDDAQTWANDIRNSVAAKRMPPWKPVPGYGVFQDSYGLTDNERQTILDWVDQGAQQGDPADLPDAPPEPDGPWQLGTPDLVLSMPQYTPPDHTKNIYRCFVLNTGLDDMRFVTAVQALPLARKEVHHVLIFVDLFGQSDKLDGQDGQPGYTCFGGPTVDLGIGSVLGGWVPGARVHALPDGVAMALPGKARLIMQVHYNENGPPAQDQTLLGLWFAPPETVQQKLVYIPVINDKFLIPAGSSDYVVQAQQFVYPFLSGKAVTIAPHMHLLGRSIKVEIVSSDGSRQPMIYIDDWNFNWQGFYSYVDPMVMPANSTLVVTSHFDNSENNPLNPNYPLKDVGWGEGTEDEMCLAFIGYIFDQQSLLPFTSQRISTQPRRPGFNVKFE